MAEQQPNAPETAHQLPETSEIRDKKLQLEFAKQELKRAEAELEAAQHVQAQEAAFGKYDVTVPNEGEFTYADYLGQRPAEAIAENDGVFRGENSGKFAKEAEYLDQTLTSQEYYDHKGGLVNEGEYQAPNYEEMGVLQLAKEAARARQLGDVAEEKDIREVLEHYLTMDAMKDDTESSEQAQARYDAEVARYEQLVDRFISRGGGETPHATDTHQKPSGEGEPSARAAEDEGSEPGVYYKGKKVSIASATKSPIDPSLDGLTVVDKEGNIYDGVLPSEISYGQALASIEDAPVDESEATDGGSEDTGSAVDDEKPTQYDVDASGKELVKWEDPENPLAAPAEVDDEEKQSRVEKVKGWFKKERAKFQEYGGRAYWAAKWEAAMGGLVGAKNRVLEYGVTEEMTDEEKEDKRKRNRVIAIVGAGALLVGGAAAVWGLSQLDAHDVHGAIGDVPTPSPSESAGDPTAELPTPSTPNEVEVLPIDGDPASLDVLEAPESNPLDVAFDIPQGGSGEQLFREAGIDITKWYNNEDALLSNFPNDFYRMNDGHVGIAHPGPLSQEAQEFIKSLR